MPVTMILAGGLGTRLSTLVPALPKVLAPVGGRPFLHFLLDWLAESGVERVILCTGHLGEIVSGEIGTRYRGMAIDYSRESSPLGTGGALRLALDSQPDLGETILVLNGDSLIAVDLAQLVAEHARRGRSGTLVVTPVDDASRYGAVEVDGLDRISTFHEKQPEHLPGLINAGVYLLDRKLLGEIPSERPVSLEREMLPQWVAGGITALRATESFIDIGTPESLELANRRMPAQVRHEAAQAAHAGLSPE